MDFFTKDFCSAASGAGPIFHQFRTNIYEPGILGILSCMILVDVQTVQANLFPLVVYPNPFTDKLNVDWYNPTFILKIPQ